MSESEPKKPQVAEHPFVTKVVGDPTAGHSVTVISGYIGRSTREDFLRIYSSPDFDVYFELEISNLVHREDSPDVTGPSLMWVKSNAQLSSHSRTSEAAARGSAFLAGDIAARAMRAPQPPGPFEGNASRSIGDQSTVRMCPSITTCPWTSVACAPTRLDCNTLFCPTWSFGCGITRFCQVP